MYQTTQGRHPPTHLSAQTILLIHVTHTHTHTRNTQSVSELLDFSPADALQLVANGKATYYLGDHKVRKGSIEVVCWCG